MRIISLSVMHSMPIEIYSQKDNADRCQALWDWVCFASNDLVAMKNRDTRRIDRKTKRFVSNRCPIDRFDLDSAGFAMYQLMVRWNLSTISSSLSILTMSLMIVMIWKKKKKKKKTRLMNRMNLLSLSLPLSLPLAEDFLTNQSMLMMVRSILRNFWDEFYDDDSLLWFSSDSDRNSNFEWQKWDFFFLSS